MYNGAYVNKYRARASNSNSKIVNPKILNIIVQKYLFLDACHVNILKTINEQI